MASAGFVSHILRQVGNLCYLDMGRKERTASFLGSFPYIAAVGFQYGHRMKFGYGKEGIGCFIPGINSLYCGSGFQHGPSKRNLCYSDMGGKE